MVNFLLSMAPIASKDNSPVFPAPLALHKAKLLAHYFTSPTLARWTGVSAPLVSPFFVFGSTTKSELVHDVDCGVVFKSQGDVEEEQMCALEVFARAEQFTHNRNRNLAVIPSDFIPIPDTYFRNFSIRRYLDRHFRDEAFIPNALTSHITIDPKLGDVRMADWNNAVAEYGQSRAV